MNRPIPLDPLAPLTREEIQRQRRIMARIAGRLASENKAKRLEQVQRLGLAAEALRCFVRDCDDDPDARALALSLASGVDSLREGLSYA